MKLFLRRLPGRAQSATGQSLVEYALILVLVAIVIFVALTSIGTSTENALSNMSNLLGNAT
ncbi:MAG: hypothetical protein AMK73_01405 [Planctomycetes bacterium SM23_32]|nr:MAG: hypothetical protein AMK73_01405 [Planctomycetes bacterium SM23_32]